MQSSNSSNVDNYITYAKALTQIRSNGPFTDPLCEVFEDNKNGTKRIRFRGYKYFTKSEDVLNFLYPNDFQNTEVIERAILCSTNVRCDYWNDIIQRLNQQALNNLYSANTFADIDDDRGNLNDLLNSDTLEYYSKPGIPFHVLKLKVGDICFLMRTLSKKEQLVKNIRVKILKISRYRIQVLVLIENPVIRFIPRIRFTIKHFPGYNIIRTQSFHYYYHMP